MSACSPKRTFRDGGRESAFGVYADLVISTTPRTLQIVPIFTTRRVEIRHTVAESAKVPDEHINSIMIHDVALLCTAARLGGFAKPDISWP